MLAHIRVDNHITLRPLRDRDAGPLFEIIDRDRDYLAEFLPWVEDIATLEDEVKFVENTMSGPATGSDARALFVIEYQSIIAGTIGIWLANPHRRIGEIGYWLAEPMQGRGIMSRACEATTGHGFAEMELRQIKIHADPKNPKSRAIPLRLGYSDDGMVPYTFRASGKTRQMAAYSMTIEDWRAKPSA